MQMHRVLFLFKKYSIPKILLFISYTDIYLLMYIVFILLQNNFISLIKNIIFNNILLNIINFLNIINLLNIIGKNIIIFINNNRAPCTCYQ